MGAPEVVLSHLDGDYADVLRRVNDSAHDGNRVLLIARHDGKAPADYESDPAHRPRIAARRAGIMLRAHSRRRRSHTRLVPRTGRALPHHLRRQSRHRRRDRKKSAADRRTRSHASWTRANCPPTSRSWRQVLENVDVLGRVLPDQKKAIVEALHLQASMWWR